ncbi:MAG: efflux RND transporter periplasmic adaptor subunit [Candidatus Palauibacterales bacterium]|nr:efflux RND transporter periplasmic adaptor subunit [Candidatus Palauibacterales bacterium]MDP2529670.1 efflux RND transporter periplasmic adaptor subunit [Candidatus Palauibacterales bacterium]MDP2584086.1 efflux RND transporter periplasmic adaptor subunit [Candidatus Palauibacterales bacterium]
MKKPISGTALLALVALAVTACGKSKASEAATDFQTATVERRDIVSSVEATGSIEPVQTIDIKSQASGEILQMPVDIADHVQKGQLLAKVDPRNVQNTYDQAKANLAVAQAQAKINADRLARSQVLADSGAITKDELQTAILNDATAKSDLVKAETNLELARKELKDATVVAPISGTVIAKDVEPGTIITSTNQVSGGTTILQMADLTTVQVRTLVDEIDIGKVQPGLTANITVDAFPNRTFHGTVLKIEPQAVVQQNVTQFAVLTRINNEDRSLLPGMNADVTIVIGQRDSVLALPNAGIKTTDEAQKLVDALGMDPSLLQASVSSNGSGATAPTAADPGREPAAGGQQAQSDDGLPSPEKLRGMSQDERRKLFQSLTADQRRKLMERFRAEREKQQQAQSNPAAPKDGFVFVENAQGRVTLKPVRIGLSSLDYTEVLAGLEQGDRVLEVPLSLVQQQQLLQRFRQRAAVPGVSRNNN